MAVISPALSAAVGSGCKRILIFLATAGAIVGMVVEAAMMVAVMTGHSLWIGAVHAR